MNTYIEKFKKVLKDFDTAAQTYSAQVADNNSRFQPATAETENAKLEQQFSDQHMKAIQEITAIFETVRGRLAVASFPTADQMNDDAKMFSSDTGIVLEPAEVQIFISRNAQNFTVLRLISAYLDRIDPDQKKYVDQRKSIHSARDVLAVYKQFAESALSLIETIYNAPSEQHGLTVDAYADEDFGRELYDVIGDGSQLQSVILSRAPMEASHLFDDVTLAGGASQVFNLNF